MLVLEIRDYRGRPRISGAVLQEGIRCLLSSVCILVRVPSVHVPSVRTSTSCLSCSHLCFRLSVGAFSCQCPRDLFKVFKHKASISERESIDEVLRLLDGTRTPMQMVDDSKSASPHRTRPPADLTEKRRATSPSLGAAMVLHEELVPKRSIGAWLQMGMEESPRVSTSLSAAVADRPTSHKLRIVFAPLLTPVKSKAPKASATPKASEAACPAKSLQVLDLGYCFGLGGLGFRVRVCLYRTVRESSLSVCSQRLRSLSAPSVCPQRLCIHIVCVDCPRRLYIPDVSCILDSCCNVVWSLIVVSSSAGAFGGCRARREEHIAECAADSAEAIGRLAPFPARRSQEGSASCEDFADEGCEEEIGDDDVLKHAHDEDQRPQVAQRQRWNRYIARGVQDDVQASGEPSVPPRVVEAEAAWNAYR